MQVIAKTKEGCIIEASEREVRDVLTAILGKAQEKIEIGQKIPAVDYSGSLTKMKNLKSDYYYQAILQNTEKFYNEMKELQKAVESSGKIGE
jgi:hypothetical protein